MQYLKDEVKSRIISSALKEFHDKGFLDASMRRIAKEANVAIGNVYRYFKSKEDLFNEIVNPAYYSLININGSLNNKNTLDLFVFEAVVDRIMLVFKEYRVQLLILMDKSKGTKYENIRDNLNLIAVKELNDYLASKLKERGIDIKDTFIFNVIAATFLEGLFIILRKYNDEDTIRYLVHELLSVSFIDIDKRFV